MSTGAAVVDIDVVKTAILEAGVEWDPASRAAYGAVFALADDLVGRGHDVVIDSPSFYAEIPERGMAIASRHAVRYLFVECRCSQPLLLDRLRARSARRSQVGRGGLPPPDVPAGRTLGGRPVAGPPWPHLIVDTSRPLDECAEAVLAALGPRSA